MELKDLTPRMSVGQIEKIYKDQFSKTLNVSKLNLRESKQLLNKTNKLISSFVNNNDTIDSEHNPTYLRLKMVQEAAKKHINGTRINEDTGTNRMTNNYVKALKAVAKGKKLNEAQIAKTGVSTNLKKILESRKLAIRFVKHIVENKRGNTVPLMEGEISSANTIVAAQSVADDLQGMIEKIGNIIFKEIPALNDAIRNTHGTEEASAFSETVSSSMATLTQNLEEAKSSVNSAIDVLTGEASPNDLDGLADGDGDLGDLDDLGNDLGDEFDMSFEEEPEIDDMAMNAGRERR